MKILHVTAHLGGGVGKALSGLAVQTLQKRKGVDHSFICLEEPQKCQFVDKIRNIGCEVFVKPDREKLLSLVTETDILQLEWWNHPATIQYLCKLTKVPLRLVSWSHVSGLHTPIIPPQLLVQSHKFLFTSQCSYEADEVKAVLPEERDRLDVVSSSGGFEGLPCPEDMAVRGFSAGYIGSFNFAKLHPRFVEFLAAVDIPGFQVRMIGDLTNQEILNKQCISFNREGMLDFRGYRTDIISELSSINVMPYLLNHEHYGTTENALIEAMSMGIVPVVLDNPTERHILGRSTGLIVHTPEEFAEAMRWLYDNPEECAKLGERAALTVRQRFSAEKMESLLYKHYQTVLKEEKRKIDFKHIFGDDPAQWFLSCQKERDIFAEDGSIHMQPGKPVNYGLFDMNKGTVFHFNKYFPQNHRLKSWAAHLNVHH